MGHMQVLDTMIHDGLWRSFGHTHMGITAENVAERFKAPGRSGLFFRLKPVADSRPLAKLVAGMVNAQMLQEIAQEHLNGRRLLMGTTQLDAQRLVIWNMEPSRPAAIPRPLQADALISIILLSTHKKILENVSNPRGLFFLIPCGTIINNK